MRIAVFIATTHSAVLVERITPETAPQSMVCLGKTSRVLPISADYDDFVRPGSGVIMRDFRYDKEISSFRLDVDKAIESGASWQLGAYIAHFIAHHPDMVLSNLEECDAVLWLSGRVDYDLNVLEVDHIVTKIEASADLIVHQLSTKKRMICLLASKNAQELLDHQPPSGLEIYQIDHIDQALDLLEQAFLPNSATIKQSKRKNYGLYFFFIAACLAILALFVVQFREGAEEAHKPYGQPLYIESFEGRKPVYQYGDELSLRVYLTKEQWVQCFYHQVSGEVIKIYPNEHLDVWSRFSPHQAHDVMGNKEASFAIKLGAPAGLEKVSCYGSAEKKDWQNVADIP